LLNVRNSNSPRSFSSLALITLVVAAIFATFVSSAEAAPTIRFKGNGLDRFKFHGRVKLLPPTLGGPVDPLATGFGIELRNQFGFLYQATLLPGDFEPRHNLRYKFMDRAALSGNGSRNGLFYVFTRFRKYGPNWYYTVRVRAFTDLSAATEPQMTVVFTKVNGTAALTAEWVPQYYGWRLPLSRF
jgi:hypothetical protein